MQDKTNSRHSENENNSNEISNLSMKKNFPINNSYSLPALPNLYQSTETERGIPNLQYIQPSNPSEFIIKAYDSLLHIDVQNIMNVGRNIAIPTFDQSTLIDLTSEMIRKLQPSSSVVIYRKSPCYFVGDIHGSLHDLLRIFATRGDPFTTNYIFLGDYVDRGNFSIEVITLLFALYCQGAKLTLLRGNHEFRSMCSNYGFLSEVESVYTSTIVFDAFVESFAYLPFVAIVDQKIFAVHGGISKHVKAISDIESIHTPVYDNSHHIINDLVWSDPSDVFSDFAKSTRGPFFTFGSGALHHFLKETNLKMIIRAHEYCETGYKDEFNHTCITLFSCSSYQFDGSNQSAVLSLVDDHLFKHTFEPLPRIPREEIQFFSMSRAPAKRESKPILSFALKNMLKTIQTQKRHSLIPRAPLGQSNAMVQSTLVLPNPITSRDLLYKSQK